MALVRAQDVNDELTQNMLGAARAEREFRARIQTQIDEAKAELAALGQAQTVRILAGDTAEVKALRNRLRMLQARLAEEIHPAHATSRR